MIGKKLKLQEITLGNLLDFCLITFIIMQVFLLEYFGLARYLNWIVAILASCRITMLLKTAPMYLVSLSFLLLLTICINLIITDDGSLQNTARSNLILLAYPFIYLTYILLICRKNMMRALRYYTACLPIFNLILLVNMVVMLIQMNSVGSLIPSVPSASVIDYYPDTISGLFAYGSVHAVALYSTFVIIADLRYISRLNRQFFVKRLIWSLYLLVISSVSVYIAANNDNKAFLLIYILALCLFYFRSAAETKNGRDVFVTRLILFLFSGLFLCLVALSIPAVSTIMNNSILSTIAMAFESGGLGNKAMGSNERIALIGYALSPINLGIWPGYRRVGSIFIKLFGIYSLWPSGSWFTTCLVWNLDYGAVNPMLLDAVHCASPEKRFEPSCV